MAITYFRGLLVKIKKSSNAEEEFRKMKLVKSILNVGFVVAGLMVMCSASVLAYIDPSVTTYGIQVVAGVVVAVGAVIGIWVRKARAKVQNKLGIDENAKKEVEEDIVVFEEEK